MISAAKKVPLCFTLGALDFVTCFTRGGSHETKRSCSASCINWRKRLRSIVGWYNAASDCSSESAIPITKSQLGINAFHLNRNTLQYDWPDRCAAPGYYSQCRSDTTSTVVNVPLVCAWLVKRRYTKYPALPSPLQALELNMNITRTVWWIQTISPTNRCN